MQLANVKRQIAFLQKQINGFQPISDEILEKQDRYRRSYRDFVRDAWISVEGAQIPFSDNWHIGAICEHLEACVSGQIKYLIINMPPRCGKSVLISIMFVPWVWAQKPWLKFLYPTYSMNLSRTHSTKCRDLIRSPWYQSIYGNTFSLLGDRNTATRFDNNRKGFRLAVSTRSMVTGEGGDFLIFDDLNNAMEAESETKRNYTNSWYDLASSTRLNPTGNGVKINVQHRLHEDDVTGHILAKERDDIVHLFLPMEYERHRKCKTISIMPSKKIWADPRKREGELLWPARYPEEYLENVKVDIGSYGYAGQFQQRPSPAGGSIFQEDWFMVWDKERLPHFENIIQSWDTAFTAPQGKTVNDAETSFSACTTWGQFKDEHGVPCVLLLDSFRDRIEYPVLKRMMIRLSNNFRDKYYDEPIDGHNPVGCVLIEAKASGISVYQDLSELGLPCARFDPTPYGGKIARARHASPFVEVGRVYLRGVPDKPGRLSPASSDFLENALIFPNGKTNDIIDTFSQVLLKLKVDQWLVYPDNYEEEMIEKDPDFSIYGYK